MSEKNPYAVSDEYSGSAEPFPHTADLARFTVDGSLIKCGPLVTLPSVCVVTGETEDLTVMKKRLTRVPRSAYVTLFLVAPLLYLILYLIYPKHFAVHYCTINYWLSRRIRNQLRRKTFFGLVLLCGSLFIMTDERRTEALDAWLFAGFAMLLTGLILLGYGAAPIRVRKQLFGTQFWLKGCQPPFFEQLRVTPEYRE